MQERESFPFPVVWFRVVSPDGRSEERAVTLEVLHGRDGLPCDELLRRHARVQWRLSEEEAKRVRTEPLTGIIHPD